MTRRSTRWCKPPPHVLSTPDSARTIECYAAQGKGEHNCPFAFTHIDLVLINADRLTMIVRAYAPANWELQTDAVTLGSGWLVLGWRALDGSQPFGELDRVDPELADLAKLSEPNRSFTFASTCGCYAKGDLLGSR